MSTVRTRFAPSPTGYMHVGNLRTALYTYLQARHNGGTFILRIEDTDQGRLVEGATDIIYGTLKATGLTWDEGPDVGGPVGPYVQSQRMGMFKQYAEQYSEKIAARIRLTEIISALDILLLIFLIVQQQIQHIQAVRENHILSKKAYLDVHTGLPNKSRCEDLLNSSGFITEPLCFVMFDLNNLKEVNDTLGHVAGDSMIANFAHILRKVVPEKDFVGRYGGDEFIAILYDTTSGQADELLEKLHATIKQYHSSNMPDAISYAYGYSYSMNYKDCTLRNLLDKADHEMYLNKQAQKKKR